MEGQRKPSSVCRWGNDGGFSNLQPRSLLQKPQWSNGMDTMIFWIVNSPASFQQCQQHDQGRRRFDTVRCLGSHLNPSARFASHGLLADR